MGKKWVESQGPQGSLQAGKGKRRKRREEEEEEEGRGREGRGKEKKKRKGCSTLQTPDVSSLRPSSDTSDL